MTPDFAMINTKHELLRHTELPSRHVQGHTGLAEPQDFNDGGVVQLRHAVSGALGLTILFYLVGLIVNIRPEEQVVRIDAQRIVSARAIVANTQAVGDGAEMEFPRESMHGHTATLALGRSKTSVLARSPWLAGPEPTAFGFDDTTPEPLGTAGPFEGGGALSRAELGATCLYLANDRAEFLATDLALPGDTKADEPALARTVLAATLLDGARSCPELFAAVSTREQDFAMVGNSHDLPFVMKGGCGQGGRQSQAGGSPVSFYPVSCRRNTSVSPDCRGV